jgi:hypothetical protein
VIARLPRRNSSLCLAQSPNCRAAIYSVGWCDPLIAALQFIPSICMIAQCRAAIYSFGRRDCPIAMPQFIPLVGVIAQLLGCNLFFWLVQSPDCRATFFFFWLAQSIDCRAVFFLADMIPQLPFDCCFLPLRPFAAIVPRLASF